MLLEALAFSPSIGSVPPYAPTFSLAASNMSAVGCCTLRNGTNGWEWSEKVTCEQCLREVHAVGLTAEGVYHCPNESCSSVQTRCGPNPCAWGARAGYASRQRRDLTVGRRCDFYNQNASKRAMTSILDQSLRALEFHLKLSPPQASRMCIQLPSTGSIVSLPAAPPVGSSVA